MLTFNKENRLSKNSTTEQGKIPKEIGIPPKVSEFRWKLGNKAKQEPTLTEAKGKVIQRKKGKVYMLASKEMDYVTYN